MKVLKLYDVPGYPCHCGCGFDTADLRLVSMYWFLCNKYGEENVIIHDGARCQKHNTKLQKMGLRASTKSQHLIGKAIDFHVANRTNETVYDDLCQAFGDDSCGFILYKWGLHVDVRDKPYRSIRI